MFCEGLLLARAECPMPAHCNVKRQLAFTHQWAPCPKMDTGGLFQGGKKRVEAGVYENIFMSKVNDIKNQICCVALFFFSSSFLQFEPN